MVVFLKTALLSVDAKLTAFERAASGFFMAALLGVVCGAVAVRILRIPVYWLDEAAIYCMVWMTFLAASHAVAAGSHVRVTLALNAVSPRIRIALSFLGDLMLLVIGLFLFALAWMWFDPIPFIKSGLDPAAFSRLTLNFVYSEPTASFRMHKAVFWLIMPFFSLTLTLHAAARLCKPGWGKSQ